MLDGEPLLIERTTFGPEAGRVVETLDLAGGMSPMAWGLAVLVVAVLMALALAAFLFMRPRELEGDRKAV